MSQHYVNRNRMGMGNRSYSSSSVASIEVESGVTVPGGRPPHRRTKSVPGAWEDIDADTDSVMIDTGSTRHVDDDEDDGLFDDEDDLWRRVQEGSYFCNTGCECTSEKAVRSSGG